MAGICPPFFLAERHEQDDKKDGEQCARNLDHLVTKLEVWPFGEIAAEAFVNVVKSSAKRYCDNGHLH